MLCKRLFLKSVRHLVQIKRSNDLNYGGFNLLNEFSEAHNLKYTKLLFRLIFPPSVCGWTKALLKALRGSHLFRTRQQHGKQSHTIHYMLCVHYNSSTKAHLNDFQLPVALMLFVSCTDALASEVPTYQHMDRQTGQMLKCTQCPAGTHMNAHCTPTRSTVCAPCPAHHFTQYWNYLPNCLYCSTFCVENQHVKEECSPKHDRVCECNDGYYWHDDFCIKHTECASGYGVEEKGRLLYRGSFICCAFSFTNEVCETCPQAPFGAIRNAKGVREGRFQRKRRRVRSA